jgi:hypothetical protein
VKHIHDPDTTALLAGALLRLQIASTAGEAAAAMLGIWVGLRLAVVGSEQQIGRILTACEGPSEWTADERAELMDHVRSLAALADHFGPHEHNDEHNMEASHDDH